MWYHSSFMCGFTLAPMICQTPLLPLKQGHRNRAQFAVIAHQRCHKSAASEEVPIRTPRKLGRKIRFLANRCPHLRLAHKHLLHMSLALRVSSEYPTRLEPSAPSATTTATTSAAGTTTSPASTTSASSTTAVTTGNFFPRLVLGLRGVVDEKGIKR